MDIEKFRLAGYKAIDQICEYYATLPDRPVVSRVEPGYLRRTLPSEAPETGEDFESVVQDYWNHIVPGLTHWQHPSFFAYFPTASTFEAILGDLYASSVPNPGFNWAVSPACTELEAVVMDWAAKMFGLDQSFFNISEVGGGVIQTSASDSALVATVVARSRYIKQHPEVSPEKLLIYTTTQTHSLGKKAGLVLGLNVRALEVTFQDNFALRGETLRRALEEDGATGHHPFILIATVGTTSSGAIDRIDELGAILASHPSIWLHVDAAWAGVAMACPEYRELCLLNDINKHSDSFCTNFHKWGLVNFDCSGFWVRDRANLTDALVVMPEFLRTQHGDAGTVIDYRNWHLGLGRRFRSLKVWFVLRSFGIQGFQQYIRKTIKCNELFASLIRGSTDFSLITPPCLALSVFRLEPSSDKSTSVANLNELNQSFYTRLATRSDIALTQTDLNGVFCIRFVVGAERTSEDHIGLAFDILCREAKAALEEWRSPGKGGQPQSEDAARRDWWLAFPTPLSEVPYLDCDDVATLVRSQNLKDTAIIDVRRNDHVGGHVRGSVQRPAQTFYDELSEFYQIFGEKKQVVFYCGSSNGRGPRCAKWYQDYLNEKGDSYSKAYVMTGGFKEWAKRFGSDSELMDRDADQ